MSTTLSLLTAIQQALRSVWPPLHFATATSSRNMTHHQPLSERQARGGDVRQCSGSPPEPRWKLYNHRLHSECVWASRCQYSIIALVHIGSLLSSKKADKLQLLYAGCKCNTMFRVSSCHPETKSRQAVAFGDLRSECTESSRICVHQVCGSASCRTTPCQAHEAKQIM